MEEGDINVLPSTFPRDAAGLMDDDGLSAGLDGEVGGGERNFPRRGAPDDMSKVSGGWAKQEFRMERRLVFVSAGVLHRFIFSLPWMSGSDQDGRIVRCFLLLLDRKYDIVPHPTGSCQREIIPVSVRR